MVSELVKCCSRRVFRFEAVLVVDRRYVIGDVGEDDFFKEFGCWGQEGNGSIGGALVGIFVWLVRIFVWFFQIGAGLYAVGRPVQRRNEEDGQIGTNQSLPLERGALFIQH